MTPLQGTKTSSAPSRGRAGWRQQSRPSRGRQGFHAEHETRPLLFTAPSDISCGANQAPNHGLFSKHETRNTNHGFFSNHGLYASLPTISHHFPRFPTISFPGPPHPPSADQVSTRRPPFLVSRPGLPPPPVAAFLRVVARHGAAMARHGRHGTPRASVRAPSAPATGPFGFSRNTRHETRITAFMPCRQARGLQGGMYEAVRKRVERGLSESREKNNDFFRIPTRFTTRYIPLFPTMTRKDSDKPLPPIKRLRALRQPGYLGLTCMSHHVARRSA